MSDLISREALQNEFAHKCRGVCDICQYDMYGLCNLIKDAPPVEAVPVVHGEWKYYKKQGIAVCTNCSFERNLDDNFGKAIACPNCGADMSKEGAIWKD